MNLLMFNLAVDAEHVTLAFGLRWIEELAKRFDHIDVVTMYEGKHRLPPNVKVWSVGRERGYPKWFRVLRFYWLLARVWRVRPPKVVFSHMNPAFSMLFAPIARITRFPSVLWYEHGSITRTLRLAHRFVDLVVSASPQGFRIKSTKARVIGHGVNLDLFPYTRRKVDAVLQIVTVGRVAPSKGQDVLISALNDWRPADGRPWKLTIVGDATSDSEKLFANKVRQRAKIIAFPNSVEFTGRLSPSDIAKYLQNSEVFISLATNGSLDKAIVESMACGCPVISCNDAFVALASAGGFGCCTVDGSEESLRLRLSEFFMRSPEQRYEIADRQALLARRDHGLPGLIDKLTAILKGVAEGRVS